MTQKVPNPGSKDAISQGCTCPVLDNRHGRGTGSFEPDGSPEFWFNLECPLHGVKKPAVEENSK